MSNDRIIEITPELNRRVQGERRKESRERIADLEQRLSRIEYLVKQRTSLEMYELMEIYRLAAGIE